jgi:hypothetical protein
MKNSCKATITAKDYFASCPKWVNDFNRVGLIANLATTSDGRGSDYTLEIFHSIFIHNGFIEYIKNPLMMAQPIIERPEQSLEKKATPKLLHGIWLTNKEQPRKISYQLKNFIEQTAKLPGFEVIIWTNINQVKLLELTPELKDTNIKIKHLAELNTNYVRLQDLLLNPLKHNATKDGGVFIDLAKYLILEQSGGILTDLNFKFGENFEPQIIDKFDFVAAERGVNRIENGFFIAKPHHPIFQSVLGMMEEIMFSHNCATDILKSQPSSTTETISMMPLSIAYIMHNNKGNNLDVLTSTACTQYLYQLNLSPQLLSMVATHEQQFEAIDNYEFENFEDLAVSYLKILAKLRPDNFFHGICIEAELIGIDIMTSTWWGADIT